jgi:predicted nucleic acid-binding protein
MKSPAVVTNASPLIYLALVKRFSLLNQIFTEVYLPDAVYREVVVQGSTQPGAKETQTGIEEGWIKRVVVQDRIAVENLLDELHIGEAETIVLAREMGIHRVLLDDRSARNKARLVGLQMTGTIGILLLAKKSGILKGFQSELDVLINSNFRLSSDIYNRLVKPDADL